MAVRGKIGVLMGGPSSEREISLKSGKAVYEALRQSGLEAVPIDIKTEDAKENLALLKCISPDCAFVALHGRFGEDGQIQELLERLKIPYTGSGILASRLAMDKVASRQIFELHGLHVPRHSVIKKESPDVYPALIKGLKFPLVIKPSNGGSSIGLSIIEKEEGLDKALKLAFRFDQRAIIEEYIKGREVTVGILDKQALPVIEIIPRKKFFDYQAKYIPGMTNYRVPAGLKDGLAGKIRQAAFSAHKLLGCSGCSRVDMILSDDNLPFILELNTIPGLTSTSLLPKAAMTAGIDFRDLCLRLIKLAYEKV
ncbi:MAG: D-alanine--D-alanine ligase [Candidatus Omnitrophota bacterium]|nr:D-alanine--D-alanine ligase [Candidatus Omnitrophota bacterium]